MRAYHGRRSITFCAVTGAMTDAWSRLHIEVHDDEIIVALPLTSYSVTYYKPAVRRQSFWDSERRRLREALARLADDVRRLADDAASVGLHCHLPQTCKLSDTSRKAPVDQ
jgi:hypothetical protein